MITTKNVYKEGNEKNYRSKTNFIGVYTMYLNYLSFIRLSIWRSFVTGCREHGAKNVVKFSAAS